MNCTGLQDCSCGCCAGISVATPRGENNRAGLPAIAYRTGTWATFRESMLARLSSTDYPALSRLKTRASDDFSIALIDAAAVMLDIHTFYDERRINESYLRTATQRASLLQLARLVGYRPALGAAASVWLAFTIRDAPGQSDDPGAGALVIPAGTQVQSVPAQGQSPQPFETSADILAKADWNALPVQTGIPWMPRSGDTYALLAGTSTQLQPGDAMLVVGDERGGGATGSTNPASNRWDVRIVTAVQPDAPNQRTRVSWSEPLGNSNSGPAQVNPVFYALRQRAALFGYNAVNPVMLTPGTRFTLAADKLISTSAPIDWRFGYEGSDTTHPLASQSLADLDGVYAKLTPGNWLVLNWPDGNTSRSPAGMVALYRVTSATTITRADHGLSGKITRAALDTQNYLADAYANTRHCAALGQSEALPLVERPLDHPLYGSCIDLKGVRNDLAGVAAVAIVGKSQKLAVNVAGLEFVPDDDSDKVDLQPGDVLTLLQPPPYTNQDGSVGDWAGAGTYYLLYVTDSNGRSGTTKAPLTAFTLTPSVAADPVAQECGVVARLEVLNEPYPHTRIVLSAPLVNCYERAVTGVNANVGQASAGRTVAEVLGSGSRTTPNQSFALSQSPLTYVQAATPTGVDTTLVVRVSGVPWTEVTNLYGQAGAARVFSTVDPPGGACTVQFGDGVEGATLPTGQANVTAQYRVGLGLAGNVAAGSITTLVDRPLGVSAVNNPQSATGGADPQTLDTIRANAPASVLTLGRAVSLDDYQSFAANFAGIAKASALWVPSGAARGVFITVAGAGGIALPPDSGTLTLLTAALTDYGTPHVGLTVSSFYETTFSVSADIACDPAYDATSVQTAVRALLVGTYAFAVRDFGQGVTADEIAALIQSVPGVIAVNVKSLAVVATSDAGDLGSAAYSVSAYNAWRQGEITPPPPRPSDGSTLRICPYTQQVSTGAPPTPAEILVIDPDPKRLVLGVMS